MSVSIPVVRATAESVRDRAASAVYSAAQKRVSALAGSLGLGGTTAQFGAPEGSAGLLRGGPLVAGVEVSVLLSESHSLSATAVKTALEDGAVVTDHVILDPVKVSIGFAMTNAGHGADQARDVFETFRKMLDERTVLELITEHTVYENMVIVGVDLTHQAPNKGALDVTVKLEQLAFVELAGTGRAASILPLGDPVSKAMERLENAGTVNAEDVLFDFSKWEDAALGFGKTALDRLIDAAREAAKNTVNKGYGKLTGKVGSMMR